MPIVARKPLVAEPRPGITDPVDRFAAKVALNEAGCLVWQAYLDGKGYGKFYLGRADGKKVIVLAHRLSYFWHKGPIPDHLELDHLCRNPACVHPDHLEAVSRQENIRRIPFEVRGNGARAQGRMRTHCRNGHPLSGDNVQLVPTGQRRCRTCHNANARNWRRQRKEAA